MALSTARPEPVLTRAGIITAIAVLSALCVQLGAGDVSVWLGAHKDLISTVLLAASPLITALLARLHVTALLDPQDNEGNALVPVGSVAAIAPAPAPDETPID